MSREEDVRFFKSVSVLLFLISEGVSLCITFNNSMHTSKGEDFVYGLCLVGPVIFVVVLVVLLALGGLIEAIHPKRK